MAMKSSFALRGFSLIEVMVAVVVLSVGLLALAALQASLTRASSETKAQSTALALGEQRLEAIRDAVAAGGYVAITDQATATTTTIGNIEFAQTSRIDRYVLRQQTGVAPCTAAPQFVRLAANQDTLTAAELAALSTCYDNTRDFKRAEVSIGWTDATNAARSVVLADVFSSVSATDTLNVSNDSSSGANGPQVRIFDPSSEPGVIPIAVGQDALGRDQSVAATDPKPQTYGTSGKVSTKFTVQTYAAEDPDGADPGFVLQRNFDTALVSCRCELASGASPNGGPYSPSYWDGDKFTARDVATGKPRGVPVAGVDQDPLCTACCRDHHDKTGQQVLFDPFRPASDYDSVTGDHKHYLRTGSRDAATFTLADDAGDQYDEACRLVRVDGVYQVTTDLQLENLVLINMAGTVAAPIIDATTQSNYSTFAKNYVTSVYSAVVSGTAQGLLADYTPSPDGLAQTDPVSLVGTGQQRQLSARALLIDWLSPLALEKLACAGSVSTSCAETYPAYTDLSIHQIFPFLTVNLTNLGEWSAANSPPDATQVKVSVTNQAIPTDREISYSRGKVTSVSTGTAVATASTYRGPAGLTDQEPVSWHDKGLASDGTTVLDARALTSKGRTYEVTSAGAASNLRFVWVMANPATDANLRTSQIDLTSADYACHRGSGTAGTDPTDSSALTTNEHLCEGPDTTLTVTAYLANYNYVVVTCGNGAGSPRDPNDPTTKCVKNNGTESDPTSVITRDYKLCSVVPATAHGGLSVTVGAPVRTNTAHPSTEYTPVTITATSAAQLSLQRFSANFYPEGTACP